MASNQKHHGPPTVHYNMQEVSSTIVPDLSGGGYAGVIRGIDRGGAYMEQDLVFGRQLPVLTLTGGEKGGYLQLPDGCIQKGEGITVSFYVRISELADYTALFSFGRDNCFYLSALPSDESPDYIRLSPGATSGGRSQEAALSDWVPMRKNTWFHTVVTFAADLPAPLCLYLDGRPAGNTAHRRMDADALSGCTDCFFGYGFLSQNPAAMSVTDIRIFPRVLEEEEISTLFRLSDQARLSLEMDTVCALFSERMTLLPPLPDAGALGAAIRAEIITTDTITEDFQLLRPASGSPDACGSIRFVLSYHDETLEKTVSFLIPALPSDDILLQEDMADVKIPFPGHVSADLYLPCKGSNGASFRWESSDPEHLSGTGKIIRPQKAPLEILLTLHASLGKASAKREFPITLYPVYGQKKPVHKQSSPNPGSAVPNRSSSVTGRKPSVPMHIPHRQAGAVSLKDVALLDQSLFGGNQKRCLDYLALLDCDRMLYNFRKAFGQDTCNALPPGGWEEPAGLLRGHSTGHFLSALAYAYASTHDSFWKEKALYLIRELRRLQLLSAGDPAAFATACTPRNAAQSLWSRDPSCWGEGYLSAYPPDQFALLEQFTPYATIWAPYYTLHKLLAGFLDCYLQLDCKTALDCAEGIGLWVYRRLSPTSAGQRAKMWGMYIAGEYGGMNESLSLLFQLTGKQCYREAAAMFDNTQVFDGLAQGLDTITGLHANQHIPQMIGAMQEFIATGEAHYYRTAKNFWELVTAHYAYSIGGVGRGENFKEPDILAANIESDRNCETCAAYNMLKLTGMLSCYSPGDSRFMDYYERTLYNQIAASQNPLVRPGAHHGVTYMLPIGPGARREYSNDYEDFTCCHGTGMENHVRYSEHIYHIGEDDGLYIQLYLSSSFRWEQKGVTLTQTADFPAFESVFTIDRAARLKLYFRIPYWCRDSFSLSVNGVQQTLRYAADNANTDSGISDSDISDAAVSDEDIFPEDTFCGMDSMTDKCGGYAVLERDFAAGDKITVQLPHRLHLCYTPDSYEAMPAASLMYGPFVMTALASGTEWITLSLPPEPEAAFVMAEENGMPVLWYDNLKFVPMYAAHNTPYHTYFKINLL